MIENIITGQCWFCETFSGAQQDELKCLVLPEETKARVFLLDFLAYGHFTMSRQVHFLVED